MAAVVEEVERGLEAQIAPLRADFPGIRPVLRRGEAASELLTRIRDTRPDLVVMGSHGRGGFQRAVLGSIAAEVVRSSPVPVLVIGPSAAAAA